MENSKYEIVPEKLFDFTAGVYCGVLMPEHVMKKLAKLQAAYLQDVKRLLTDHKDELYPSSWTLHYPEGKQTQVKFTSTETECDSIESRINNATIASKPVHCPLVFNASSMEEAEAMANAHYESTHTIA